MLFRFFVLSKKRRTTVTTTKKNKTVEIDCAAMQHDIKNAPTAPIKIEVDKTKYESASKKERLWQRTVHKKKCATLIIESEKKEFCNL